MNDEFWKKITQTFLKKVEVSPDEHFVTRVMARIEDPQPAWKRWLVPSFGAVFASVLFALTVTQDQNDLSAEDLLADDVVEFNLEELS